MFKESFIEIKVFSSDFIITELIYFLFKPLLFCLIPIIYDLLILNGNIEAN